MKHYFTQRIAQWLTKRIPAGQHQILNHQKIFIFPTAFGFWFLCLIGLLFVLGTNYQNNVMRLLASFLLSLFLLHLHISYFNFSKLRISARSPTATFADQEACLPLNIGMDKKAAEGIVLFEWWGSHYDDKTSCKLDSVPTHALIPITGLSRGVHRLPRLTLRCDYPLGLFKCWTHLDFDQSITVYPSPIDCPIHLVELAAKESSNSSPQPGGHEDFYSLRPFKTTDPLSNVAWKQLAKNGKWLVKEFEQSVSSVGWLTFKSCSRNTIEDKLGELTYQILTLSDNNAMYGLCLPGVKIEPGQSLQHKERCLKALATYPVNIGSSEHKV